MTRTARRDRYRTASFDHFVDAGASSIGGTVMPRPYHF